MMLNNSSKIWIFQLNRDLYLYEEYSLYNNIYNFCLNWKTHNKTIISDFEIRYNRFIVIGSKDEISGCSIDYLNKQLDKILLRFNNLGIFRPNVIYVTFFYINKKTISNIKFNNFISMISSSNSNKNNIYRIFNNYINNFSDYKSKWLVPLHNSWVNNYIN